MFASPSSYTRIETLAQAWLGAGATAVSVWDRHQLLRHWPAQEPLNSPDFVTPVRINNDVYGEMHISGFSAPGWASWRQPAPMPQVAASAARAGESSQYNPRHLGDHLDAPAVAGIDIFADSRPCIDVGGDYVDFVRQPSGSLAFSVADIAGKGLSAALLMPGMHRALRGSLQSTSNATPAELLAQLNEDVYSVFVNTGGFATALLGSYDPETRIVTYANAGHSPVIHRSASGEVTLLMADSIPLGIAPAMETLERSVTLEPGELFIVGTDGLADARNRWGHMFGYTRLLTLVDLIAHWTAGEIGRGLLRRVADYAGYLPQVDDYTVMVLKGVS